jgi:hypothetical protein
MVPRSILLSFLLSFSHLFYTPGFLSGKNTITLKNGKPSAHDSGGKKSENRKKEKNDGFVESKSQKNRE